MKKLKEFLIFIISLAVLIAGPLLWFVFYNQNDQISFISNWNYLKLFVKDGSLFNAVFNSYLLPALISFSVLLILLFVIKNRKLLYPVCIVSSMLIAFIYNVIFYEIAYQQMYVVTVYDVIIFLQVAVFTTFIIWLIELICCLSCLKGGGQQKRWRDISDIPLYDIAKQNINGNKQITVLLTDTQNVYLSTEIDGADVLDKLKSDPNVVTMLTMWQSGEVDLPSMTFRKSLVQICDLNLNTDIVLRSDNGYVLKKLNVTL